jgi:hypothetical protein
VPADGDGLCPAAIQPYRSTSRALGPWKSPKLLHPSPMIETRIPELWISRCTTRSFPQHRSSFESEDRAWRGDSTSHRLVISLRAEI